MNRTQLFHVATFALVTAAAVASPAAFADNRCDKPGAPLDQRACAKAAQGPDALRRYVERTRNIYALYYYDYAREGAPAVATTEPLRTAGAPAPSAP